MVPKYGASHEVVWLSQVEPKPYLSLSAISLDTISPQDLTYPLTHTSLSLFFCLHNNQHSLLNCKLKPKKLTHPPAHSGDMAAVAVVGSSLSISLKCLRSKTWSSDPLPRIAPTRVSLQVGLVSQINATVAFPKWRVARISAVVAQEEAAAAVEEAEEVGGGEAKAGHESANNPISTKIYFGNLPYHCDSAQLAGIIQQYASPELVEVCTYNQYPF